MEHNNEYTIDDYKKYICDLIEYINDFDFIKTMYSVFAREANRAVD